MSLSMPHFLSFTGIFILGILIFKDSIMFYSFVSLCVDVCVNMHTHVHTCKGSEDRLQELVFSFYHVSLGNQSPGVNLGLTASTFTCWAIWPALSIRIWILFNKQSSLFSYVAHMCVYLYSAIMTMTVVSIRGISWYILCVFSVSRSSKWNCWAGERQLFCILANAFTYFIFSSYIIWSLSSLRTAF